jgi:hypothetical protein
MTMQVGVGESAARPISRFQHGFAACSACCEPRRSLAFSVTGVPATKKAPKGKSDTGKQNAAAAAKPHRIDVHHHIVPPR